MKVSPETTANRPSCVDQERTSLRKRIQGHSQDFSNGWGVGHTGSNNIVMAFSPQNIVGWFA